MKNKIIKYLFGVLLFVFIFGFGFLKMNLVYSSTGIGTSPEILQKSNQEVSNSDVLGVFSSIEDNAFIKIYEQGYGYDLVLRFGGNEKIFSLKFPWKTKNKK